MKHNPLDGDRRRERFEGDDLTRRILARTSGRACDRAAELLATGWDGPLAGDDQALLDDHLAHCAACRELAVILDRLQPMLPRLAEREPDPAFTRAVLARTTGVGGVRPTPTRWLDRLADRLAGAFGGLWNRPRFALEAGWTAAALLALVMWSPLGSGDQTADRAADVITAGTRVAPALVHWVEDRAADAEAAAADLLDMTSREAVDRLAGLGREASTRGEGFWNWSRSLLGTEPAPAGPAENETETTDRDRESR
ncbi:hypothetical protein GF314_04135 [bacterium]|nr:hypothetical protein [bacterium]